jgi:hypothetical protein
MKAIIHLVAALALIAIFDAAAQDTAVPKEGPATDRVAALIRAERSMSMPRTRR